MSIKVTGLDDIINNLDKLVISEQTKIKATNAAAQVCAETLAEHTPESEYDRDGKHLKEFITYKPDQNLDHSTDVGFSQDGYYFKFVNNGTVKQPGQHFIEHSYDLAEDAMSAAMFTELKKDVD